MTLHPASQPATPRASAPSYDELAARLAAAEAALEAVLSGAVDALTTGHGTDAGIVTLERADSFFVTLVTQMQEATASLAANGTMLYANPRFAELLGLPLSQVLGRTLAELTPQAGRPAAARLLADAASGPARATLELIHGDGRAVSVAVSAAPIAGEQPEVCLVATDLTERKAAEELVERQRRQLLDAQSVGGFGSWEWDSVADTAQWSDVLCRIYGVKPGTLRGLADCLDLIHPGDRARMAATLETAGESGEPFSLEHRIVRGDGLVRVLQARGEVVTDDAGRPLRMLGTCQDITERKTAEEARAHLAALVDGSADAIIATTLGGLIKSWNPGAQALFGYTADEAVGQPIAMIVPAARADELAEILARVKRGVRIDPLETMRIAKDGRAIDVSLRISPVHDASGELIGVSSIARDISGQKLLEAELRRSSRYFERARDLTVACSFDGYFKNVNPAVEQILGWSAEEFLARPFVEMMHPDDREATLREVASLAAGGVTTGFVVRYRAKDGSYRWLDWNAMVPPDERLIYASARDITERVAMETALREAEQRFRTAFDRAPIGVCLLSIDPGDPFRLLAVNAALADILGATVGDLTGGPLSSVTHLEDQAETFARLCELSDGRSSHVEFEKRLMHRNGYPVWALISASAVSDGASERRLAVTHIMDISDRKRSEGQLQHLADHDALTGLFNRRRFTAELARALRHAKRFEESGAVLFLDLDGFKRVNDTLGHAGGDELLVSLAGLLNGGLRETDTLARIGGDEFAILLPRCGEPAAALVAEKLLAALRVQMTATNGERPIEVSASIGIAVFHGHEELDSDELVIEADIAMYDAKEAGKDRYCVYDRIEGRRALVSIRDRWRDRLQTAIAEDDFVLHAQPITPICAAGTAGFELLLRLPDEHGDLIPPGTFLYNAERFGLIEQIDRLVLEHAVRHIHASQTAGFDLILSVNVSGRTMGDPGFGAHVAELLSRYPIPHNSLIVEITETAAITNLDRARSLAQQLRALGCQLALDDFGAGFASFYYLKHLHFDSLKIDGEFIRNLCATDTDQLFVQAVVTIAHGLGATTVAEFVGQDATVDLLRTLGVDYGQGYHLGRPLPLDQSLPYLIARGPRG